LTGYREFLDFYATDQVVLFAGLAIAIVPPLVVFAFLQRSFTHGLTIGASQY
jgi:ABC-type glycerol-3-phosphate transport system permease component